MLNKICPSCSKEKSFDLFFKSKKARDGHCSYCKECSKINHNIWKQNNLERHKLNHKSYYLKNKDQWKLKTKEYRENNKDIIKEKRKQYRLNNIKEIKVKATFPSRRFVSGKAAAKLKKVIWKLTRDEYYSLIEKPCHYCGNEIGNVQKSVGIGLDRIDNDKNIGYTLMNVVPCCKFCNKIKNNFLTLEETEVAARAIVQFRKQQSLNNLK